jgi:HlyD family secretion protein
MSNLPGMQDRIHQNGHFSSEPVLAEERVNLDKSSPNQADARLEIPVTSNDEWSYLTKELVDTLPQVWSRGLLYFLVIFAGIILPWSMLFKIDETGSSRGRLEPKGSIQKLDTIASGVVSAVKVKEGQTVKAGQIMLELESDVLRTDLQQVQTKLEGLQNRLAQLNLLKNQLLITVGVQERQNQAQEQEKMSQINQAEQNLDSKKTAYNLQKEEKQTQLNQAQQNLDSKRAIYNLQKVEKLAQIDQARHNLNSSKTANKLAQGQLLKDLAEVQRYRKLWQQNVVPEIKIIELDRVAEESKRLQEKTQSDVKQAELRLTEEQKRYESIIYQAQSDVEQAELRLKEEESRSKTALQLAQSDIDQAKLRVQEQQRSRQTLTHANKLALLKSEEQLKDLQRQVTSLETEMAENKSQIKSLNLQLAQRVLRSPVEGTVFQLPIQRPGVVAQSGQAIAQIAPKDAILAFKAQMPISESGFLRKGMSVKLKFDAYPFQDYGVIPGHLTSISPDSKILETPQGKTEVFELEITLDQNYIQDRNKRILLSPGQTATAEVIVRQRRVIDFILDPFKKLQKGGLDL